MFHDHRTLIMLIQITLTTPDIMGIGAHPYAMNTRWLGDKADSDNDKFTKIDHQYQSGQTHTSMHVTLISSNMWKMTQLHSSMEIHQRSCHIEGIEGTT